MTKFEKDFRKWFSDLCAMDGSCHHFDVKFGADDFRLLPKEMRYGVFVDFFDSVGLIISINKRKGLYWDVIIRKQDCDGNYIGVFSHTTQTRLEAQESALKKAIEIYNL